MIRQLKYLAGLALAATIAACGGGGGSAGSTGNGTGAGGTATATVSSFIFQLSKATINNAGSDSSLLTVTALDANNNPVSGAAVNVAVDTGVYTPVTSTTDTNGQATGNISSGSNKANRDIKVTIRVSGKENTATVTVQGAAIAMTPVPATPTPGSSVRVDVKVTDSNGTGVAATPVELSGTLGLTGTVTTDNTGVASATLPAAPANSGTYTVEAKALGVSVSRSVQVISSTGGGIAAALGPISSASLAIVPNTISPNAVGKTTSRAGLRAKFLNANNQAIQNVRVRFEIVPPGLGSGELITTGSATVYSDSTGEAIADYIAGTRSSPTDGVTIRACYGLNDASIANGACPNSVTKSLTVASQPLSITLGDNNLLEKGNNSLTYIKKFDVAVADAAGNPVANATVSASVDIGYYGKGLFATCYPGDTTSGTTTIVCDYAPAGPLTVIDPAAEPSGTRVWCLNEDKDRNGALDAGDDINGNGKIEPRKADVILSFVGGNVTNSGGRMNIQVEYPQNVATWLTYTVKVTTNVAGSEGTDSKSYITDFIEGDEKNGSFLTAPYGAHACNKPN